MSKVKCQLKDVVLERDNGFKLNIPELDIPIQNNGALNRMPLMGKSGAGKSTLLNVMAAIEWPSEGRISWSFPDNSSFEWRGKGEGLSTKDAYQLRGEYFGYAFQDSTLMPHLRVCDNLSYPLMLKGYSTQKAYETARKRLDDVLLDDEKENGDALFRRFPSTLSGGQRQRIALTQAMIHDPYVIFADEPTGSLDKNTRKQVMDVLFNWVNDPEHIGKRLLVWVTHHEKDPQDAGVEKFLRVDSGLCGWEECFDSLQ